MSINKLLLSLLLVLSLSTIINAASTLSLARSGQTKYTIVFNRQSNTLPEQTAANELKSYLNQITGADFKLINSNNFSGNFISIGRNKLSEKFLGSKLISELGPEEFIIKSSPQGNIYIIGGRPRGTLYGVLHFLDNILGVRWLTYDYTYIPSRKNLAIKSLDIRLKPNYEQRFVILSARHPYPIKDSTWLYRNRIDRTAYQNDWYQNNLHRAHLPKMFPKLLDKNYGIAPDYAAPSFAHTIPRLIPAKKYFKKHPEWWELINGKRQNNNASSAMCLSNNELIQETAKNALTMIKKRSACKYISISEGDCIKDYCHCVNCRSIIKKCGAKSGLILNFVNQVAAIIHKERPDILVTTLAYTNTEKAPQNIKAGPGVMVRLCVWSAPNSEAYNHPQNKRGIKFLNNLEQWRKVCPTMGIWDYVTTYYNNFIPHPNLHTIIPNLKTFHNMGARFFLAEADHNKGNYRSGESAARMFLLSRGLWNANADTNKLLKDFTDAYYGEKAAVSVRNYWDLLKNANRKENYMLMFHSGNGEAPYLRLPVMLKSAELLKQAMETAPEGKLKEHAEQLFMQVQFVLLNNWKSFEKEASNKNLKMPGAFEQNFSEFTANTKKYGAWTINMQPRAKALAALKRSYYQEITVTASKSFGGKPDQAFDKNGKTAWNGGALKGWLQIKFKKPRTVSSIYTIFNNRVKQVNYEITGSLDGKNWQTLVPRKNAEKSIIIQKISTFRPIIVAEDEIKPVKVRYVKTRVFGATQFSGKPDWVVIREQTIE